MRQTFSKISSVLLAFLVLFSTFSFTVEKHYCGEFLMNVSFIGNAENCGMEMEAKPLKKKCCKNETHQIEGQDELQQFSIEDFDLEKQQLVVVYYLSCKDLFIENESKIIVYKDFSPPDIPKDYQILYQSFLI